MLNTQFAVKDHKQPNPLFLELEDKGNGIVELWGYGPSNAYRIGVFENGLFRICVSPPSSCASIKLPPIPDWCFSD